jgi:hypothetical protein
MTRYFVSFSIVVIVAVGTTMVLGLSLGDLQSVYGQLRLVRAQQNVRSHSTQSADSAPADVQSLERAESWARVHRIAGIASALLVVLLYSVGMTYFIGTSRWCREVVETYDLPAEWIQQANRIKRRAFPWSLGGMLWAVAMVALGAAADPSTGRAGTPQWVQPHFWGALLGLVWLVWSMRAIYGYTCQQFELIQVILADVREKRAERGLAV